MSKLSKYWSAARTMPPLRHSIPGQPFDIKNSEVAEWLCSQPEIMQHVFSCAAHGHITYCPETGMWEGIEYEI